MHRSGFNLNFKLTRRPGVTVTVTVTVAVTHWHFRRDYSESGFKLQIQPGE